MPRRRRRDDDSYEPSPIPDLPKPRPKRRIGKSAKANATEQSAKKTKQKGALAAANLPPAKRQKTTAMKTETDTKPNTSESDANGPSTPKRTGDIPQESSKPHFRTFPETPKTPSKGTDVEMHKTYESDSDIEPQSMAVHNSSSRRLKAVISRLKSRMKKKPNESLPSSITNSVHQENDENKDMRGPDHSKITHISKGHIVVAKENFSTLMSRTVTVNKMISSFIKAAGDVEDANVDENPALAYLLAEARSLSFGVQSLTNAITKLPAVEKHSSVAAKVVTENTEGVVSEQLPVEKPGDGEESTGPDLATPTKKIVIKVSKEV
ncbi:hypothetical protein LZ32DRAFT_682070 [Colletotrichum eremochloae]|nr:hypothetical protein LZ32DRAFT_682070 [Colletotrichum eremochloae]